MPAKSNAQRKAAGAALQAKRREKKVGDLKSASKGMDGLMGEEEREVLAATHRTQLPEKKPED